MFRLVFRSIVKHSGKVFAWHYSPSKLRWIFFSRRGLNLLCIQTVHMLQCDTHTHTHVPTYIRSRVQKFPAWRTKSAPNGKCCEGYTVPSVVRLMYQFQACWNKGRLCWKIAKLFYFCRLKKLVRPEPFGPYYISSGLCGVHNWPVLVCSP